MVSTLVEVQIEKARDCNLSRDASRPGWHLPWHLFIRSEDQAAHVDAYLDDDDVQVLLTSILAQLDRIPNDKAWDWVKALAAQKIVSRAE